MKLVIGGYAQGKLEFVLQKEGAENCAVFDGMLPDGKKRQAAVLQGKVMVIHHFHRWVRKSLQQGNVPEEEIVSFLEQNNDCVIICDEIGNGIVPMEAFEREYRERTGRILVELAKNAEEVVRVLCGIGQKIK